MTADFGQINRKPKDKKCNETDTSWCEIKVNEKSTFVMNLPLLTLLMCDECALLLGNFFN